MHKPYYSVVGLAVVPLYGLRLQFADGCIKFFDFTPLLDEKLYSPLKDTSLFAKARAFAGGVVWTDEIDINPEFLYDAASETGRLLPPPC